MEGLPSGDIQVKYQKLASEYSKLRVHVKVLKKGVLDEQAKNNEFRNELKEKDKALRKNELEIDSLTFRNQQLTRRISVLQDELDALQTKSTKKSKSKQEEKTSTSGAPPPPDRGILQEELQKKILENAQFASQLSDKIFEVSQLKASLEDYQKILCENDNKYKCEIAKLKNKNHELQFSIEELSKERNGRQSAGPSTSHIASCNGDFLSEGGSIIGSEDALSSVDDLNMTEQLTSKMCNLEQDNAKLRMELELGAMEREALRLEVARLGGRRGRDHDSGDYSALGDAATDAEGRMCGLLGDMQVPFVLGEEVRDREERVKRYFRNKLSQLTADKQLVESKTELYERECEMLRLRLEEADKASADHELTLQSKHNTISRLEEELTSTSSNYEGQLRVLSEHVAALNDTLAQQHDHIERLTHRLANRK